MTRSSSAYKKRWQLDRELGRPRTVPVEPVRRHIAHLRALGWSWRGIAEAAGLGEGTARWIVTSTAQSVVRVDTARRILALTPESINERSNPAGFVPAIGTRRRIRALLAIGWTHAEQQARSGILTAVTVSQAGEWVTRATADAVKALYDELAMTPGPSVRTRARAARLGYAPPLAWDDSTIDDPAGTPDIGEVARTPGRPPVDVDEFMWLINTGEDPGRAARRLGVTLKGIERAARRHGRDDVLAHTKPSREDAA